MPLLSDAQSFSTRTYRLLNADAHDDEVRAPRQRRVILGRPFKAGASSTK
jgi:hypothetical protein